jgi:hypothetical protein
MPYGSFLDEDEDGEQKPYSSVSSRSPLQEIGGAPDPVVKNFLAQKMATPKDPALDQDPMMQQYLKEQSDLDDFRQAKLKADTMTNMGAAFSQLAQGVNTPKDSGVFKNIASQNQALLNSTAGDVDRRQKVRDAIEARKLRSTLARESQQARKEQLASQQADRVLNRELAMSYKHGKDAEKREDRDLALAVPGYDRTGEVLPKPEEAMKFRRATASAEQLQNKLKRLRDLVGEVGSFEYGGERGQEMDSLATEIQLLSKNEDMYNLGVLTGPDMGLLQKITASPSSIQSLFTRDSTRKKQIDTQLKSIQDKLESSAKSMGYKKGMSAQQEKDSGPQSDKVIVSNGKETLQIDPSDLAEAEKDGYKRM